MVNFFEKLKKGMGIEESISEPKESEEKEVKEIPIEVRIAKKPKKIRIKTSPTENKSSARQVRKLEIQSETTEKEPGKEKIEEEFSKEPEISQKLEGIKIDEEKEEEKDEKKWPVFGEKQEGQLAIDVYQTENDLVIQSAIAGIKPENLDISMERDIIAIKGNRPKPSEENGDYFSQECFWGPFSREVILPAEVDPERAEATMKDGILIIRIPKILREKKRKIAVKNI